MCLTNPWLGHLGAEEAVDRRRVPVCLGERVGGVWGDVTGYLVGIHAQNAPTPHPPAHPNSHRNMSAFHHKISCDMGYPRLGGAGGLPCATSARLTLQLLDRGDILTWWGVLRETGDSEGGICKRFVIGGRYAWHLLMSCCSSASGCLCCHCCLYFETIPRHCCLDCGP